LCGFLGTPNACPATIGELGGINRAQVGCGKRLVSRFDGTEPGYSYLFDLATGELLGGCRHNDVTFGPCRDSNLASYSFGETPSLCSTMGWTGIEQDCSRVVDCQTYGAGAALGLANCMPSAAGGGTGGSAGSG
jgi:hypothetical protein